MNKGNMSQCDIDNNKLVRRQRNNKGFSLVELLIALAVGGIVLSALTALIQNSVHNFTRQTVSAQLQNDADVALNQIENDIMEADMLVMYHSESATSGYDYYLTEYSQVDNSRYCGYIWDKASGILYYSNDFYALSENPLNVSNVSVACEHVEDFSIKLNKSCVSEEEKEQPTASSTDPVKTRKVVVITQNIKVKANIKLSNQNVKRDVTREISLRNSLYGKDMTDDIKIVKKEGSGKTVVKMKDCQLSEVSGFVGD